MVRRGKGSGSRAVSSGASGAGGAARRRWASAEGGAEIVLWLLVLLVPVVLVPTARHAFTLPKLLLAGWLGLASVLILALAAAWRRGGHGGTQWREPGLWAHPALRPAALVALPVLAAAGLSWGLTEHRAHANLAMVELAFAAVVLLGWTAGLPSARLRRPLAGLLVPTAVLSGLAILQFHGTQFLAFTGGEEATRVGVTSLAGNAGHLGGFLAFSVVVGQAVLPRLAGWRRAAALVALAAGVYGVVATLTLTSVLALAVGSAAVWWALLPRRRAAFALAAVVGAALLLVFAVSPLRDRAGQAMARAVDGQVNVLLTGRLDGWRSALWMFGEEPLAGVGPGAYVAEFNEAKLALLDRGVPFYQQHEQPTFANAHNEVLEVAAEWGVPGVAALLWALWVLVAAVRRVGRRALGARGSAAREAHSDAALARGGLAVLGILALAHFPFRLAITGYPALLWLAWLLRRATELRLERGGAEVDGATSQGVTTGGAVLRRVLAWAAVVALVAVLAWDTVRAQRLLRASTLLNTVEQATVRLGARGRLPTAFLWGNLRLLRTAEELSPASVGVRVAGAGHHLLLGHHAEAAEGYRRALDLEPRPEIWFNLGRAQEEGGEPEAAMESWVTAARLDPTLLRQVPAEYRGPVRQRLLEVDAGRGAGP